MFEPPVFVSLSLWVTGLLFVPVPVFHIVCFIVANANFSGLLLPGYSSPLWRQGNPSNIESHKTGHMLLPQPLEKGLTVRIHLTDQVRSSSTVIPNNSHPIHESFLLYSWQVVLWTKAEHFWSEALHFPRGPTAPLKSPSQSWTSQTAVIPLPK